MWTKDYWTQDFQSSDRLKFGILLFMKRLDEMGLKQVSKKIGGIMFSLHGGEDAGTNLFDWGSAKRRPDSMVLEGCDSAMGISSIELELSGKSLRRAPSSSVGSDSPRIDGKPPRMREEGVSWDDLLKRRTSTQSSDPSSSRTTSITASVEKGLLSMNNRRLPSVKKDWGDQSILKRMASDGNMLRPRVGSESILKRVSSVSNLTFQLEFMDVEPRDIAAQLDAIEFGIFRGIQPRDLLHHIWDRHSRGRHSPPVHASIKHFNYLSIWFVQLINLRVQATILDHKKVKERAKALLNMLKIAIYLRETNNYNSLIAVLSGINSSPVLRLKQTWKLVEGKRFDISFNWFSATQEYLKVEKLMRAEKSFELYRVALKESGMPCVPYLGVVLKDLLYIEEANKDYRSDGTLNLAKFLLVGDIILMVQSYQKNGPRITRNNSICDMVFRGKGREVDLYARSLELEAKVLYLI
jgi:hypothetical protein